MNPSGAVNSSAQAGLIQLVATPIGNLGDLTFRAIEALRSADLIACEDTRHSRRLLDHYEIRDKNLTSLHEHNELQKSAELASRVRDEGLRLVYLSDAGMPGISDPGYRLVNAAREAGVRVEVLPGACAVVTALAGSGLPSDAFHFGGFLPVKSGRRGRELAEALARRETSIFYESPHRIAGTLERLAELDPDREICVARELTKRFETYHRGSAAELARHFASQVAKGEITLLIRGAGKS